ncbi:DUF3810 domain-containing protein [Mesonia aestuariivivens]|uniref:DUF3810 domain-containing protein n=1 Tax=Mesonia aestuariivivens TaxID=2796128 RepID=A0ABS6W244_9FLAO|nr:DUF3810 domain-containing protein [Mesonia aestuariivivens]MBW2961228.1 DUF3810 domain-containing protein [Mesonia aestuariivivens]
MKQRYHFILALLLPLQVALVSIAAKFPQFIETYYSNGFYPIVSKLERYALGWLPFSVGDLVYAALVICLIRWIYIRIKTGFKKPKVWIVKGISALSILYFSFHFFWGLNYYRLPLHQSLEINHEYSQEELINFTKNLAKRTNKLHLNLVENDTLKVDFQFENSEIRTIAIEGYQNIENEYPELAYQAKSIKPSIFSIPLTYMGFNGYLNPLTNEAQVNNQIPKFKLPSTTSHEMGHQIGYAKENEANFMACLTTMDHQNPYFKYAGYTFALKYCLGEVNLTDPCEAQNIIGMLNLGIIKNYREVNKFWDDHENPLEPFFKLFYGNYLRANNQPQGIKSYNYVVALLVNYFKGAHQL